MTLAYAQIGVGSMEFISSFLLKEHPKANPTVKKGALLQKGSPHHKHTPHPRNSNRHKKGSLDEHVASEWHGGCFCLFFGAITQSSPRYLVILMRVEDIS